MTVNNKLEMIRNETVVAYFKILLRSLSKGTK